MTGNEIIKVLKCCKGHLADDCIECPYIEKYPRCTNNLREVSIDLINRQKAQIERLEKELHRAKIEISKHFDYMDIAADGAIKEFAERLKASLDWVAIKNRAKEEDKKMNKIDDFVILKCKEKDLVYNMHILCENFVETAFRPPYIINGGRWFYFPIKHKSEIENLKLKGKILE